MVGWRRIVCGVLVGLSMAGPVAASDEGAAAARDGGGDVQPVAYAVLLVPERQLHARRWREPRWTTDERRSQRWSERPYEASRPSSSSGNWRQQVRQRAPRVYVLREPPREPWYSDRWTADRRGYRN